MSLATATVEIRSAPVDDLTDPAWLAHVIASAGLYDDGDGRTLYGEWEPDKVPPKATGVWQHPDEFAAFLIWMGKRAPRRTLDIGCFHGVGTILMGAYFRRFNPESLVAGIDVLRWQGADAVAAYPGCLVYTGDAAHMVAWGLVPKAGYDLVFVDADHSYDGAKADWFKARENARFVAFHDVNDDFVANTPGYGGGVPRLWREIKAEHPGKTVEFIRGDGVKYFGIGCVVLDGSGL